MKHKTNILYVTLSLDIGGLEVLLLEFLKKLDRDKFNPAVCVLQEKGELVKEEIERLGIPVYVIPKKSGIDLSLPLKLRKLTREKGISIVHTHNSTPWLYAGMAVKGLKDVRLIHTKHSNLNLDQKRLLKAERYLAKKTDYIIADSRDVADFMKEKQQIPAHKIRLIFNGVDTGRFNNSNRRAKSGNKVVATVGRLAEVKDQRGLISAFKSVAQDIPGSELWIIGEGPLRQELEEFSQASGLGPRIKFLGNRRDIPELLQQVDVFTLSSLSEGMSIGLLEAMASGIPVVVTRVGGNPEIVQDNQSGLLVEPCSPEELSAKIIKILKDDSLAKRLGENGRERVVEKFSILAMVEEYSNLYDHRPSAEKICLIGEFPPPFGGMAIQAQQLSQKLAEEGLSVSRVNRNSRLPSWIGKIRIVRGIIKFLIFNLNLLFNICSSKTWYIFANSFLSFYLYTLTPVWLGRICGKRIIINFHGGAAGEFLSKPINFLCRKALASADFIIVPSGYLKEILTKFNLNPIIIPNLIDFQRFAFKERVRLQPNFIVTRHLEPEYNNAMVIRAFATVLKQYPRANLSICGNGSEKEKLQTICAELGVNNAVRFLDEIKNEDLPRVYDRADIMLNGSNVDNLPVSILEAFACGLPVVSSRAGGIPYVVENEKTGLLVDLNDAPAMAKSIISLLENPQLAQAIIENGRKAAEKYSWTGIKLKLLPLLKYRQNIPLRAKIYQKFIFPLFDSLRGRRNLGKLQFLRQSQYWPKEAIEEWQLKRLNELLAIAKEKSPFHKERLRNLKLPLTHLGQIQDIPVLTKKDVRRNLENIKCQGVPENLFILGKTGGSTGEPMHYYYDKRGRDWNRGCVYRSQEWSGTFLGQKTLQMTGSHYDYTEFNKLKSRLTLWLQRYKYLPISFVNDELLERYYRELLRYKPSSIWGYSSAIYLFANFIAQRHPGTDFNFLKALITSSETLFDFQRKKINEVFGEGKVFDHYGSREIYIASECAQHRGYHIHCETVIAEVVDSEGKPKKAGDMGRILITDLSNRVFPFIRYEIGDVGVMAEAENCPCGITLPKLAKVEGRIADVVILPDRMLTPPNFTILLSDYEGIEEYQIIQKSKTELILNIVKNSGFKAEYEEYIKKSLSQLLGPAVNFRLEYVNSIAISESGKRRYVISEISSQAL